MKKIIYDIIDEVVENHQSDILDLGPKDMELISEILEEIASRIKEEIPDKNERKEAAQGFHRAAASQIKKTYKEGF